MLYDLVLYNNYCDRFILHILIAFQNLAQVLCVRSVNVSCMFSSQMSIFFCIIIQYYILTKIDLSSSISVKI